MAPVYLAILWAEADAMGVVCYSVVGCALETDVWECGQMNGWMDAEGRAPWGDDTDEAVRRYLATVTPKEYQRLVDAAMLSLDCGAWQGLKTKNGGWVDGEPSDERERRWRETAKDFAERYRAGETCLTEGMIAYAGWDLALELAFLRRWCPMRPARTTP